LRNCIRDLHLGIFYRFLLSYACDRYEIYSVLIPGTSPVLTKIRALPVNPVSFVLGLRVPVFFSSRRRHTRSKRDWSSDVCSSDLVVVLVVTFGFHVRGKDVMTSCPFLFPGVLRVVDVPVTGPVVLPVVEIGTMPVRGHRIQVGGDTGRGCVGVFLLLEGRRVEHLRDPTVDGLVVVVRAERGRSLPRRGDLVAGGSVLPLVVPSPFPDPCTLLHVRDPGDRVRGQHGRPRVLLTERIHTLVS